MMKENTHIGATAYCGNCNKFNYNDEIRCCNCNCLLPRDLADPIDKIQPREGCILTDEELHKAIDWFASTGIANVQSSWLNEIHGIPRMVIGNLIALYHKRESEKLKIANSKLKEAFEELLGTAMIASMVIYDREEIMNEWRTRAGLTINEKGE